MILFYHMKRVFEALMEILTESHCIVSMTFSEGKQNKLYVNEGSKSHGWMGKDLLRLRAGPGSNYGMKTGHLEYVFFSPPPPPPLTS